MFVSTTVQLLDINKFHLPLDTKQKFSVEMEYYNITVIFFFPVLLLVNTLIIIHYVPTRDCEMSVLLVPCEVPRLPSEALSSVFGVSLGCYLHNITRE